jgi:hypothetical protein
MLSSLTGKLSEAGGASTRTGGRKNNQQRGREPRNSGGYLRPFPEPRVLQEHP